jgi:hypothetical protein
MQQGLLRSTGLSLIIWPLLASCHKAPPGPTRSISIDREVFLRDVKMKPNSATRLPDGGFMVTAGGLAHRSYKFQRRTALAICRSRRAT